MSGICSGSTEGGAASSMHGCACDPWFASRAPARHRLRGLGRAPGPRGPARTAAGEDETPGAQPPPHPRRTGASCADANARPSRLRLREPPKPVGGGIMQDGPRVLVAAALGKIIEPLLRQSLTNATLRIAEDRAAVERAVGERLRFDVVDIAVRGGSLTGPQYPSASSPPHIPRIHAYFGKGRGSTAARLAGAIASGRAVNHETLASAAHVGYDTAAKLVDYLGPLIKDRGEHGPGLKMTPEVVYRWCGEHARYILSWCRRNGQEDIAARVAPGPGPEERRQPGT